MLVPSAGDRSGVWTLLGGSSGLVKRLGVGSSLNSGRTTLLFFTEFGGCGGLRNARSDYPSVGLAEVRGSLHRWNGLSQMLNRSQRYCLLSQHATERVLIGSRLQVSVKCSLDPCPIVPFGNGSAALVVVSIGFGQCIIRSGGNTRQWWSSGVHSCIVRR